MLDMGWMVLPYRRYADFGGRSQRMEYWMFTLFYWLVLMLCVALMLAGLPWGEITGDKPSNPNALPGPPFWLGIGLMVVFLLGSLVPSIAVTVRRFHDQDLSGWLYLLNFIPYIGGLVVFVFMCIDGTRGPNRYGNDPKDSANASVFA